MQENTGSGLDWKLVLAVTPLGLVFAALTITGTLDGVRATQWTALGLLAVVGGIIGLRAPRRPFRHGLAAGFLAALVAIEAQALFLPIYFANNPQWADLEMPFGWSPRLATAVLGPLNTILPAVIVGALAWGFSRASRRRGLGS
ncbi:MAG: hypothetical protein ACE5GX_18125 [Thermoanaerobaculia bacterium]